MFLTIDKCRNTSDFRKLAKKKLCLWHNLNEKIIKNLKFRSSQTVVSFISTITILELKKMIKVKLIRDIFVKKDNI